VGPLSAFFILGNCEHGKGVSRQGHFHDPAEEIAFTHKWKASGGMRQHSEVMRQSAITKGQIKSGQTLQPAMIQQSVRKAFFFQLYFVTGKTEAQSINDLLKRVRSRNRYNSMALDAETLSTRQASKATPSSVTLKQTLSLLNWSWFFKLAPKLIKASFSNCTIKINYVHKLEGKEIACAFWVP
jgi:hypothetical protein